MFLWQGRRYRAWNVGVVAPRVRAILPRLPRRLLDGAGEIPPSVDFGVEDGGPVVDVAPTPAGLAQPSTPAEKRALVFGWLADHPAGTQADFRRWLDAHGLAVARGYISDLFAEWDGMSAAERLAALGSADGPVYVNGARLGVDPSQPFNYGGVA
jgi:hypothetical protein